MVRHADKGLRYAFIKAHRSTYRLELLCRVLEVSVSGYYAWQGRGESKRAKEDVILGEKVAQVFGVHKKRYGSPRIQAELLKEGKRHSRKRIARLMQQQGLQARSGKRRKVQTTDSKHREPVAANVLERRFEQKEVNKLWCSDITYIHTAKETVYLAVVIDLCSRHVIGWHIDRTMESSLVTTALFKAMSKRRKHGSFDKLLVHSDRGSQYASTAFRSLLARHGMVQSMSGKGDCWDNAVAESFFHTLKEESKLAHTLPKDLEDARTMVYRYIEMYYNSVRLHSTLGYMSPLQFEELLKINKHLHLH